MSETCPTVTIETKNGPVVINECDFDSDSMKLYKEKAPAKSRAKAPAK